MLAAAPHQDDGQQQADDQDGRVVLGGASNGEDVVERHRDVGDHDLPDRSAYRSAPDGSAYLGIHRLVGRHLVSAVRAQLPVHFPADPQQQDAAGQRQANDGEELGGDEREKDAKGYGGANAPEDDLAALLERHRGGGHANHDGVIAGQDKVDGDDLPQSRQLGP
jgi:hypothetical protein